MIFQQHNYRVTYLVCLISSYQLVHCLKPFLGIYGTFLLLNYIFGVSTFLLVRVMPFPRYLLEMTEQHPEYFIQQEPVCDEVQPRASCGISTAPPRSSPENRCDSPLSHNSSSASPIFCLVYTSEYEGVEPHLCPFPTPPSPCPRSALGREQAGT